MIKHIVFWKMNENIKGDAREQALRKIKEGFEALHGKIPGLLKVEIGVDNTTGPDVVDIILYSEFESQAALDGYQAHPLHTALVPLVRDVRVERRVGDYEV
jgi:hypothetical protein